MSVLEIGGSRSFALEDLCFCRRKTIGLEKQLLWKGKIRESETDLNGTTSVDEDEELNVVASVRSRLR